MKFIKLVFRKSFYLFKNIFFQRQNHFLHELFDDSKLDDKSEMTMLQNTYINSFSLVDVLGCPGNLPKLRRDEIPFLVDTLDLRGYQIEGLETFFI